MYMNLKARYRGMEDKNDFDVTESVRVKCKKTVKIVASARR